MASRNGRFKVGPYDCDLDEDVFDLLVEKARDVAPRGFTVWHVPRNVSEGWRRDARRVPGLKFSSQRSEGSQQVNGGYEFQDVHLIYTPRVPA